MFCTNCGAEVTPDQKFCNRCGVALNPPITYQTPGQLPPKQPPQWQRPQQPMPAPMNQAPQNQPAPQPMPMPAPMPEQPTTLLQPEQNPMPAPESVTQQDQSIQDMPVDMPVDMPQQPGMPPMPPQDGGQMPMGMPPMQPLKKKPVWPIFVAIIAALLLVSVLSVWGVNKLVKVLTARLTEQGLLGQIESTDIDTDLIGEQEDILEDLEENFGEDGIPEDFMDDFDQYGNLDEFDDFFEEFTEENDYEFREYDYATVLKMDGYTYVECNGKVDENTELRPDKDLKGLCDYIDNEVLEDGKKIDRNLLYDLVSVHIVDHRIADDDESFENNLMYCLSIANEFEGSNIRIESCMYNDEQDDEYYYDVSKGTEFDTWIVNPGEGTLFMDYGTTEYKSEGTYGMFSPDTLAIWMTVIENYYGIE